MSYDNLVAFIRVTGIFFYVRYRKSWLFFSMMDIAKPVFIYRYGLLITDGAGIAAGGRRERAFLCLAPLAKTRLRLFMSSLCMHNLRHPFKYVPHFCPRFVGFGYGAPKVQPKLVRDSQS